MATRILLLLCVILMAPSVMPAKRVPRTMATRRVIEAKAFSLARSKARESTPKKQKQRRPKTRQSKAHWGS